MYLQQALSSLKVEKTKLLEIYFSEKNMNFLQNYMIHKIEKDSDYLIGKQSDYDLYVIMQFMYVEFVHRICGTDEQKVKHLNNMVLKETLPMIKRGIKEKQKFLVDSSTQPKLLDRGISTSIKGTEPVKINTF